MVLLELKKVQFNYSDIINNIKPGKKIQNNYCKIKINVMLLDNSLKIIKNFIENNICCHILDYDLKLHLINKENYYEELILEFDRYPNKIKFYNFDLHNCNFKIEFRNKNIQKLLVDDNDFNIESILNKIEIKITNDNINKKYKTDYTEIFIENSKLKYLYSDLDIQKLKRIKLNTYDIKKIIDNPYGNYFVMFKIIYDYVMHSNYIVIDQDYNKINEFDFYDLIIFNKSNYIILEFLREFYYQDIKNKFIYYLNKNVYDIISNKNLSVFLLKYFKQELVDILLNMKLKYNYNIHKLIMLFVYYDYDFPNLESVLDNRNHTDARLLFSEKELVIFCKYLQKRNLRLDSEHYKFPFNLGYDTKNIRILIENHNIINLNIKEVLNSLMYIKELERCYINFIILIKEINENILTNLHNITINYLIESNKFNILQILFSDLKIEIIDKISITDNLEISKLIIDYSYRINKFISPIFNPSIITGEEKINLFMEYFDYFNVDYTQYNKLLNTDFKNFVFIVDNYNIKKFNINRINIQNHFKELFNEKLIKQNQRNIKSAKY